MFHQSKIKRELQTLLHALCDDRLSDEQAGRLAEILQGNAEAKQRYLEILHLDTSLRYWAGIEGHLQARSLDHYPQPRSIAVAPARPAQGIARRIGLVAAIACCIAAGWFIGIQGSKPEFGINVEAVESMLENADGRVGFAGRIVKFTPESRWLPTNLAVMRGTYLRPGQVLELERGVAEVQLAAGASAILEGPAKFEVKSDAEGFLHYGKVTFAAFRDSDAVQVTLSTPSTRIHTKTGEIGTTVDERGVTDVQVLSGSLLAGLVTEDGSVIHRCSLSQGSATRFNRFTELVSKIRFNRDDFVVSVPESYIAYRNYQGSVGNQVFEGSLGMDFVVIDPIQVTKLGVFDSNADGLKRSLRAELWVRDEAGSAYRFDDDSGVERIAEMTFTPDDPGILIESNRFKRLPSPIVLAPGAYTIVASGYGLEEPNGNEGDRRFDRETGQIIVVQKREAGWQDPGVPIHALKGLDDGDVAIMFVGSARWDDLVGQFPRVVDSGAVNRFQAGSFEFERLDQHSQELRRQDGESQRRSTEPGNSDRSI
ncbi:MAG: hypothetical protein L0228_19985 [Planctomycetes bacterium]|nr:hypothetical protein [Planctomycetota bacterium]